MIVWTIGNTTLYPVWTENFLSSEEIHDLCTNIENIFPEEPATVFDPKMKVRESEIRWVYPTNDYTADFFDRLTEITIKVNSLNFYKHMLGFEPLQYTVYNSNINKAYYGMHRDCAQGDITADTRQRTLSFSIQLTDPEEYDGGDLIIYDVDNKIIAPKDPGSITFFHSELPHEVMPVTRGIRKTLVGWVGKV